MTAPDRRVPLQILAASFLFNLGQGVLRPSLPLYLQRTFAANYRMVTLLPVVFGAGKWIASLPTGYLSSRLGGPLMVAGLALIGCVDVVSVMTSRFDVFLVLRAFGGLGWAMFATVATAATVSAAGRHGHGRSISLLLMSETLGLLAGTAAGGWLYQGLGVAAPFLFEAGCMAAAALAVSRSGAPAGAAAPPRREGADRPRLLSVLQTPGVLLMGVTSALLMGLQTGVLVFLFPLYLLTRGGLGPEGVGAVVSLGVLGRLVALGAGGAASDRWDRMRVLRTGLLLYAGALAVTGHLARPWGLAVASFAIGALGGVVAPIPTALTSDRLDGPLRGVAIGWLRTMSDTGQIVGPLVMGVLADALDLSVPFGAGAALLVVTAWWGGVRARAGAGPGA